MATMTTEQALLAAVWADPHDDLPRLVYADWLDETDDPASNALLSTELELGGECPTL
jgi:uncharacterized protein (TIGR02996 family)